MVCLTDEIDTDYEELGLETRRTVDTCLWHESGENDIFTEVINVDESYVIEKN